MSGLFYSALVWGGCVFWLSVVGLLVWVVAVELSGRWSR